MATTEIKKRNVPRSVLLPSYMRNVPLWEQLCDAMDDVLGSDDWATAQLRTLRDPYAIGPKIQKAIAEGSLYDTESAEYQQDINLLLRQLTFAGLPLSKPSFLSAQQVLLLFRNIGEYWFAKGTGKVVDFFNFTLGTSLTLSPCWTADYITFVSEEKVLANPLQYPLVTNGGTWYPTTHVDVDLGFENAFSNVPIRDFVTFFKDAFNYNLVLHTVNSGVVLTLGGPLISMNLYVEESFFIPSLGGLAATTEGIFVIGSSAKYNAHFAFATGSLSEVALAVLSVNSNSPYLAGNVFSAGSVFEARNILSVNSNSPYLAGNVFSAGSVFEARNILSVNSNSPYLAGNVFSAGSV